MGNCCYEPLEPGYYQTYGHWYYVNPDGTVWPAWRDFCDKPGDVCSVPHRVLHYDMNWLLTKGEPPQHLSVDTRVGSLVEINNRGSSNYMLVRINKFIPPPACTTFYETIRSWNKCGFEAFVITTGERATSYYDMVDIKPTETRISVCDTLKDWNFDHTYRVGSGLHMIARVDHMGVVFKPPRVIVPTSSVVLDQCTLPVSEFDAIRKKVESGERLPVDLTTDARLDVKCMDGYYRTARIREVAPDGFFTVVCDDGTIVPRLPYNTEDIDVYGSRYQQRPPLVIPSLSMAPPIPTAPPPYAS
jgi:hypothetical protein